MQQSGRQSDGWEEEEEEEEEEERIGIKSGYSVSPN